ncbi:SusD/RagB family nutrient-binding outer membrane lipoprotein [Chitinophaga sp. Cy-1792]|uniref:SusD/RagB family nutrient-binding outer membrane lipoprotein n=1 Tax=Chitinophaga sp. Cy-1792 TaxID=2608339 RepID=UPI001422C577|nr:SusD/RagB family nutrient-binding outer membrane lipoprotein [Chitinophaga sp. Cy-1792]NIG52076.1 SusD/RagB family nutrient-binding outer membrane lipoprotein [Chitinophaga sp. Cy-1792]
MKSLKILSLAVLAGITFSSCNKKFDEYGVNQNRPAAVPPSMVIGGVLADMNADKPWSSVMRWNQFDCCNYNYYGDQRYDWGGADLGNFFSLTNVLQMEKEATRLGGKTVNPYSALGKFFRAYFYYRMTNLVGDLPLNDALQGLATASPKYASQKEVFVQLLKWLEDANSDLGNLIANPDKSNTAEGQNLKGDIYFGNDLTKWQRAVNSFHLRVLIALSKKTADTDLQVAAQFKNIFTNPTKYPLIESMDGNLQFIYNGINKYPSNPDNLGNDATRYNMSATYLNTLVSLNDPRAYITAEPATQQLNVNHKTPADITAYVGAPSGQSQEDMSSAMSSVDTAAYSVRSRARYYSSYAGEPGVLVGYPEVCFNIAEAINRGWITGDAESYYKNGIKASLGFYSIPLKGSVTKTYAGANYTIPFDFDGTYYVQASVKYAGNNAAGLTQILQQKYLAFFENSGWEAYFNYRRTGVPVFSVGTGTGNSGAIPVRWKYPDSERSSNTVNWTASLQSQFGSGTDDINAAMWLIK